MPSPPSSSAVRIVASLLGLATLLVPGRAGGQQLTVEQIYGSDQLAARTYEVVWMAEPGRFARLVPDEDGVSELWSVDAVSGDSLKLISAAELTPQREEAPLAIESVQFSTDGRRVLIFADAERVWRDRTRGSYYVFDLPNRELSAVGASTRGQMFARFSPDGGRVAFVRDGDLHVFDIDSGAERRLTHDGGGVVVNGTSDWLYEEELGLRAAFRWSPDGERIAFWRFDQSPVPIFPLYDATSAYPAITPIRYPKAGESNSAVRIGTIEVESGRITWFDVEGGDEAYLPWMEWAASSEEVLVQRLNRRQNQLDVLLGTAATGETRLLFSEVSDTWLEGGRDVHWMAGGEAFVWPSDRDGYRHLYVYGRDGELRRQLTSGAWAVMSVEGVDTTSAVVYFVAAAESPMTRAVMASDLDGTNQTRLLVGGRGMRSVSFSPDFSRFIETASTISTPPVVTLRERSGDAIRVIDDNAELLERLDRLRLREPEFTDLRAADGTRLNAWIMKPRSFDPSRAYPLLMYTYGGPGSQTVVDGWGGERYLWHQMLVERGVLVASVDNRGTGARGRAYERQIYRRLGQLEAADQLAAARQLADLAYVDPEHVGIWGWSYGGYLALMTALSSNGFIIAAVAVAPVTDWMYYDTAYTERFMQKPEENPEGYRLAAPARMADQLRSDLLIVHGTGDDNVHPQHTTVMIDALIAAGRPFDMALYPNRTHSLSGGNTRVHLFDRISRYLLERLATEPATEAVQLPDRVGASLFLD